jgi:hypothetical protein
LPRGQTVPEIAAVGDENGVVLTPLERKIVRDALRGLSVPEIAHAHGVDPKRIKRFLAALDLPQLRRAFQKALEEHGLDAMSLAKFAAEAMQATRAQWNKADQDWDTFPDWPSRISTWRHLTKLHELEPTPGKDVVAAPRVTINVDLGSEREGQVMTNGPDHLRIEISAEDAKAMTKAQLAALDAEVVR